MSIINSVDRRVATGALIGAILSSGTLALGGALDAGGKKAGAANVATLQQVPSPGVPPIWAIYPTAVTSRLMAIDALIQSPPGGIDPLATMMAFLGTPAPQLQNSKLVAAKVIADRRRTGLLPALVTSIAAQATPNARTRVSLTLFLHSYVLQHGDSDFTPVLRNALLQVYGAPIAPLSTFETVLRRLLQELGELP